VFIAMPDSAFILSFLILFGFQVYSLAKLFSMIDDEAFNRYRLLGPFALLMSGVLKPGGIRFLVSFLLATATLFLLGLYFFEFGDLVLP
jgi:hypothetical protein